MPSGDNTLSAVACKGEAHIPEGGKDQVPGFPGRFCQVQGHHLEIPEAISTCNGPSAGKSAEGGQVGGDLVFFSFAGAEVTLKDRKYQEPHEALPCRSLKVSLHRHGVGGVIRCGEVLYGILVNAQKGL